MSRRSTRARSHQIFAELLPYVNVVPIGNRESFPPTEYWNTILQSYHESIDRSYWVSTGEGDVYVDAMMHLQKSLERWTKELVQSAPLMPGVTCLMQLFPTANHLDEDAELPIFLHYDSKLFSRWKALFQSMAGSKYWGAFEVKNISLPRILMDEFTTAMEVRTTFFPEDEYSLTYDNNLGTGSISSLSRVVNERCLTELTVMNSTIDVSAIYVPNHLRKLDLSRSDTGDDLICLSTLLSSCPNLQELFLNNMPSGIIITNDCLGSNPPLELLELKSNFLGDYDSEKLAASLGTNTNLKTLSLHGNDFSKVSENAFTKAICNNEDMNAVIDSNHTCTVRGVTEEIEGLQCTKHEKKFISIKPNGASFIDVPLELMPMVLAWLQSVPTDEVEEDGDIYVLPNATSFMFDALRSYWDLPSLFVGRHQPEEVKMCLRDMVSTVSNEEVVCGQSFHQALLPPRKHGEYDTILPRTNQGLLINVGEISLLNLTNEELLLLNIGETGNELTRTLFLGYRRFPDGSKGSAEIFTLVKKYRDVITAVNGISIVGKSFKETLALIKKVNLPFFHMRLQSQSQTVKKSILRPILEKVQSQYDRSYQLKVKLEQQVNIIQHKYDALIMSQNEEVQEGCQKSERLKRLHAREQAGIKNDLQRARDTFEANERIRGKTWGLLCKVKHKR